MRLSESWLREWVNLDCNSKSLFEQILMIGFDVNKINLINLSKNGILVGKIIQCINHPYSDKYKIIKIDIGSDNLLDFICGFFSFKIGTKVVVALSGVVLSNNFKVKNKKIYNKISNCIICTYYDLFLSNSNKFIELSEDFLIGSNINKYFNFNNDVFEINSVQNRSDCLSVLGIARELAAVNNTKLNMVDINFIRIKKKIKFPVIIESSKACPRFLGVIIRNININVSIPIWIKKRLFDYGIISTNPVIDIINYVLIELGQPVYVYDFDKLIDFFSVRMAREGEEIILLNKKKVILKSGTLVTSDKQGVLSIAGVIGGKRSSINKNTVNIFLESAYFNPNLIFKEVDFYSISTESFQRFKLGVDFNMQYKSINRVINLIIQICGGIIDGIIDKTNTKNLPKLKKIKLNKKKIYCLLGFSISDIEISKILKRLGFKINCHNMFWCITVPSWRFDINIEEDLIEEVVRIYGYNRIPIVKPNINLIDSLNFNTNFLLNGIKNLLVNRGYNEVITYSFVDPKIQKLLFPKLKLIILSNPISFEMSSMRASLITGLLNTVIYNQNRQQNSFRFFEFGLCFLFNKFFNNNISQELMLSGVISGNRYKDSWVDKKRIVDFYDIKGDVESILKSIGILNKISFKLYDFSIFHPFQSAKIYLGNNCIGFIGLINPKIENLLKLNNKTFVFELKWDLISKSITPKINEISKYPISKKDISIMVPDDVFVNNVLIELKNMNLKKIISIELIDVYYGKNIKKGYKSLTIRLYLQDYSDSLKEKEIVYIINECISRLKIRFNGFLREK